MVAVDGVLAFDQTTVARSYLRSLQGCYLSVVSHPPKPPFLPFPVTSVAPSDSLGKPAWKKNKEQRGNIYTFKVQKAARSSINSTT